jgi:hypothetical protein
MALEIQRLGVGGGWSTELGPSARLALPSTATAVANPILSVPFLVAAEHCVYNLDGWPQKMPGAVRVNASATGASDHVTGIFDYWNAAGTQRKVIYSGTAIYSEDGSGTLTSIATGLEADKMPWAEVMNDTLVLASTSNVDVPSTWDQTTFAALGGTPPNFAFHVQHKDRMWAAGVLANPSRLYYSVLGTPADWIGAGSGSIDIAPNDGDSIRAIQSHKNELLIFKGPSRRSIYRLTGSAPTGADAFVLIPFIKGVGAINQQAVIRIRDDLIFPDDQGLHSLAATAAFGDYNTAFLSQDIASWWVSALNHARLPRVWGANFVGRGYALWTLTRSGAALHDCVLLWDYRFTPTRFALWPTIAVGAIGMVLDVNRELTPWFGTYTGRVLRGNRPDRNWDGAAYTMKVLFPYLDFGDAYYDKSLNTFRIAYAPKSGTFTLGVQRDGQAQQLYMVTQSGTGDTLG